MRATIGNDEYLQRLALREYRAAAAELTDGADA